MIYESIQECDEVQSNYFYESIFLSGGNTMLEGFSERLLKEIEAKAPKSINVRIFSSPDRKLYAWKGGSTLTSLSTFSNLLITKEDYDEWGPRIVHRKCD